MNESRVDCGDAHVAEFWSEVARAIVTGEHESTSVINTALCELNGWSRAEVLAFRRWLG